MNILITGANGLLGQKIISQLSGNSKYIVVATAKGENRNPKGSYHYENMDITKVAQIREVFEKWKPNVVINTAAMTQVDDCEYQKELCWQLNVEAVKSLVNACENHHSFMIHLSTDFIFDGKNGPYKEDDSPNPLSYYAQSKLASEEVIKQSKCDWAIVRTMLVYGIAHDMSRSNIILWVKNKLENKEQIKVVNDQWRMPTLAENLAEGCILIATKKVKGVFHISGKDMLTPYQMAIQTADFFYLDKSLIQEVDGSQFKQPAQRPVKTGFVLQKAIETLGYKPKSFQEGLEILASQLKSN